MDSEEENYENYPAEGNNPAMEVKKILITTNEQFAIMANYMEKNPSIARGMEFCKLQHMTRDKYATAWAELSKRLNGIGPPVRKPSGWQKVWNDVKRKARVKLVFNARECKATGGGPFKRKLLTPVEKVASSILNLEMAVSPSGVSFGLGAGVSRDDHHPNAVAKVPDGRGASSSRKRSYLSENQLDATAGVRTEGSRNRTRNLTLEEHSDQLGETSRLERCGVSLRNDTSGGGVGRSNKRNINLNDDVDLGEELEAAGSPMRQSNLVPELTDSSGSITSNDQSYLQQVADTFGPISKTAASTPKRQTKSLASFREESIKIQTRALKDIQSNVTVIADYARKQYELDEEKFRHQKQVHHDEQKRKAEELQFKMALIECKKRKLDLMERSIAKQ